MSSFAELVRDLLAFIAAMFALFIVLVIVVANMPDDNPLKRILHALSYRVCATLGLGILAVPIEPVPGVDVLYDIGVPVFLLYYWITFVREVVSVTRRGSPRPSNQTSFRP